MPHNLLYETLTHLSSKLLHKIRQLEQVLVPEQAATVRHGYERIFWQNRGPGGRNRCPSPSGIMKVDSVLAPVVAVRY